MDSFGFTRKKFIRLREETRHSHVIKWLSRAYQSLRTNRMSPRGFETFGRQYNEVRSWMELSPLDLPEPGGKAFLVFVSDAVQFHRGCLGLAPRDEGLLPSVIEQDRDPVASTRPGREILVALDGLRSLFNVGSIFRSCDAAGVKGLILGNTPGKEHPKVVKTAMGSQEWMDQEKAEDLYPCLMEKKAMGYTIIGVETVEQAQPVNEMEWPEKMVLVMGNEEYGISPQTLAACDAFVTIPMMGRKNSLNVANAASVVLFHAALAPI
ncbi:MAG: RNA methyltransferase [Desulfobacterales bacterium]|nr:RNA methyltransferase [Desulfobacterales bacterium]